MFRLQFACICALHRLVRAQLGGNKTWNREAQLGGWPSRHSAALVVVDASQGAGTGAFLLGGEDSNGVPFVDVWYSEGPTQFVQWSQRTANASYGLRSDSSASGDGAGLLLVSGGFLQGQRQVLVPPPILPANGTNTTGNATVALVNVTLPLDDAWVSTDGQIWTSVSTAVWGSPSSNPSALSLSRQPTAEPQTMATGRFGHSTVWVPWADVKGAWWLLGGFALPVNSSYTPPSPLAVSFLLNCSAFEATPGCDSSQAVVYALNDVRQMALALPDNSSVYSVNITSLSPSSAWAGRGYAATAALPSSTATGGSGTGQVYISGGVDWASLTVYSDTWWSSDGSSWALLQPVPSTSQWSSRYHHALVASAGVLWLLGGSTLTCTSTGTAANTSSGYACIQGTLGDVWRSDVPSSPSSPVTSWLSIEASPSLPDLTRLWGPRTAFAAAATTNPTLGGIALAGGVVYDGLSGLPSMQSDLWSSTSNLLCERDSVVCSGAGRCAAQQPPVGAEPVVSTPDWLTDSLLPLNCTCNAGYGGPRCAARVCDARTCVYGTCTIDTRTGAPSCLCNDPSKYKGARCDIPVCSSGCSSVHGSCTLGPGRCDCEPGWAGSQCAVPDVWFIHVSQWIEQRAGTVFTGTAGLGLLFTSLCAMWMNVRASQPPSWAQASGEGEGPSLGSGGDESTPLLTGKGSTPRMRLRLLGLGSPVPSQAHVSIGVGSESPRGGGGWATPTGQNSGRGTPAAEVQGGTGLGTPMSAEGGRGARSSGKKKRVTFAAKEEYAPD